MGQMHYLPLAPAYFAMLVGFFLLVVVLLATLRYAYLSLGVHQVRGLGAPVASIGGAGTFDGIFLIGILAVLLASLYHPRRHAMQSP